jgi:hypothetical protein
MVMVFEHASVLLQPSQQRFERLKLAQVNRQHKSGVGLFSVVCVANRLSKATLQLAATQDDLLRMYCLDRRERHDEVPRILYVDHKFRPAVRGDLTDSAEFFPTIGDKRLIPYLDHFSHDSVLLNSFSLTLFVFTATQF